MHMKAILNNAKAELINAKVEHKLRTSYSELMDSRTYSSLSFKNKIGGTYYGKQRQRIK